MAERRYPVPSRVQTPLLGGAASMSDIDLFIEAGYGDAVQREWAIGVRRKFVQSRLDVVCAGGVLPYGLVEEVDDVDVVVALTDGGRLWRGDWVDAAPSYDDVIPLTTEEVAFAVEALSAGVGLALLAATPLAFLGRGIVGAAPSEKNMKVVAVVDDVDREAVLELLAIAPGPIVFRRHDGKWERDNDWLRSLRGVKPPPLVALGDDVSSGVIAQIDEATRGKPFKPVRADGFDPRLHDMQIEWLIRDALTAGSGRMPANLKKYWVYGKGAAKIRWGTPGAWRRCYRQLSKYMNPYSAKGACTNIAKLRGGHGVATHVGA